MSAGVLAWRNWASPVKMAPMIATAAAPMAPITGGVHMIGV